MTIMPLKLFSALLLTLGASMCLAACGSQSYADSVRPDVDALKAAIQSFNESQPTDLRGTGKACSRATVLMRHSQSLLTTSAPADLREEASALKQAFVLARDGFNACARGARNVDFHEMMVADNLIAQANASLERSRRLGH